MKGWSNLQTPRDPAPWGSYLILFSTVMLGLGMVLPDPLLLHPLERGVASGNNLPSVLS